MPLCDVRTQGPYSKSSLRRLTFFHTPSTDLARTAHNTASQVLVLNVVDNGFGLMMCLNGTFGRVAGVCLCIHTWPVHNQLIQAKGDVVAKGIVHRLLVWPEIHFAAQFERSGSVLSNSPLLLLLLLEKQLLVLIQHIGKVHFATSSQWVCSHIKAVCSRF